ncbi:hypothetical protein B0H17DRAFT_452825 [Mycena rosella]|uniref:Integral membrane protein n=1 Tax=Mycena rosella TaxID=1033263 RepID=A0AAD7MAQ6_MYCRO|nr:hypothetical protein B0H17DRAFT_452825 [Mycena rosella]
METYSSSPVLKRDPADEPTEFSRSQPMVYFKNAVALASYEERIKSVRNFVWRDQGQSVTDLSTLRDCLEHAAIGGFRSAALAFNIRASFNLLLALIKMRKVPRAQWLRLRHAIFGSESLRFAAMLGTFAALYKFLLNALPILIPAVHPSAHDLPSGFDKEEGGSQASSDSGVITLDLHERHRPHPSLCTDDKKKVVVNRCTRRWHSALAGAISGGLAILWETQSQRSGIAQQVFVRGLQGAYNICSDRWGISIPYGTVIVFSLACGQIMYASFLRPDTLPRSVHEATRIPADSYKFNIKTVQENVFDMPALDRLIERPDVTPTNLLSLISLRERAIAGAPGLPRYIPCHGLHPDVSSCRAAALHKFIEVSRWIIPTYSVLHFVRSIVFRWNVFCADPAYVLARASVGTVRSSAFLGAFGMLVQAVLCIKHGLYERLMTAPASSPLRRLLPQHLIDALIHRGTWWLCGLSTGLALLIEDRHRRAELTMYVLPKALESLWLIARGHGLVLRTGNWGEGVLAGVGMGMVMTVYQNDPQHLSGLVRKILYQFIGPN